MDALLLALAVVCGGVQHYMPSGGEQERTYMRVKLMSRW